MKWFPEKPLPRGRVRADRWLTAVATCLDLIIDAATSLVAGYLFWSAVAADDAPLSKALVGGLMLAMIVIVLDRRGKRGFIRGIDRAARLATKSVDTKRGE